MNDEQRKAMWANKKTPLQNQPSVSSEHFLNNPQTPDEARILRLAKKYNAKAQQQSNMRNLAIIRKYSPQYDPDYYWENPEYEKLRTEYNDRNTSAERLKEISEKMRVIEDKYHSDSFRRKEERSKLGHQIGNYGRFAWKNRKYVRQALESESASDLLYNNYLDDEYDEKKAKTLKGFNPKLTPYEIDREKIRRSDMYNEKIQPVMEAYRIGYEKIYADFKEKRDQLKKQHDDWYQDGTVGGNKYKIIEKEMNDALKKNENIYNKKVSEIEKKYKI
tara:strand:- start:340 stop:1167 length:828 start_codon:yes stop_codon:yes gene_type:complete